MITLNTNKQEISLLAAKKGDVLWINRVIDESVLEFAEVKCEGTVLRKVTFVNTDTLVTVTGLHANGTAATTLNFAREDRGRDVGKIFYGFRNRRFWPKLRAAVHKLCQDVIETVSATGGLEFIPTFEDEWLLPDFGQEYSGNIGYIIERKYIERILAVLEPEKVEEEEDEVLATFEALGQKYGVTPIETIEQELAGALESLYSADVL